MKKIEFINSELANLTDEFKKTKIMGNDGNEYTFEDYLKNYLPTIMRDDFTFGDDDFFNNVDSLIMLQESMTGVKACIPIEIPKLNKKKIEDDIRKFLESKGYGKYLSSFFEYNKGDIGTLEDMIKEFIIPNMNDYGLITENGISYSYQELISKKIEELNRKDEEDLRIRRTLKKDNLLNTYKSILDYPVNNLDKSITTIGGLIESLTKKMDYEGKIEYQGNAIKVDKLIQTKALEAERLYTKFNEKNDFITSTKLGISSFEDFIRIASLVDENAQNNNIIFTLLFNLLNNINQSLNEKEKSDLIERIEKSNIKNIELKSRAIATLKGVDMVDNLLEELDASEKIKIALAQQNLKKYMEKIDQTEEYTVQSANRLRTEFFALVDDLIELLQHSDLINSDFAFLNTLEKYKDILTTRCNYEEEKQSIISSYRRLKADLDSKSSTNSLNDFYFAFNTIANRIEELKALVGKRIKLSKKDQTNFDTMCATVDKIKEAIAKQEETGKKLQTIL